jgi:hypothetical protein
VSDLVSDVMRYRKCLLDSFGFDDKTLVIDFQIFARADLFDVSHLERCSMDPTSGLA